MWTLCMKVLDLVRVSILQEVKCKAGVCADVDYIQTSTTA